MPLQSISNLVGVQVPVYDTVSSLQSNTVAFYQDQKFVAEADNSIATCTIVCIVFCILFLVAGIGAIIYTRLLNKKQE